MAVLETLRSLFVPARPADPEVITPAPPTKYAVRALSSTKIKELLRLNIRCFPDGDSYNRHTLNYLLNEPSTISYCAVTPENDLVAFLFAMINGNGAAHLTTIGVAPEHRRRGLAMMLLENLERKLRAKGISTVVLEVRVGNFGAQDLYRQRGYTVVQRINSYYNNGEDCYLMMKSLI